FIETKQPRLLEDRRRGERDHVTIGDLAARNALAKAIDALMHLGHEFMKMGAPLMLDPAVLEKQVHQHGLATPDLAIDIQPARRATILALIGKYPAEQPLLARRLIGGKPFLKRSEGLRGLGLR